MNPLIEYITTHGKRGACTCGLCADAPENPEQKQPQGHTADVVFFKVAVSPEAKADELRALIKENRGEFCECNLFDGSEHNYIEIGGWIGDQGLALTLMGMGACLGLWDLLTPRSVFGGMIPEEAVKMLAGKGLVAIQHRLSPMDHPSRTGKIKTREQILTEIKAGRKSRCMDGRDYSRLTVFFPASDFETLGFTPKEGLDASIFKPLDLTRENVIDAMGKDLTFAFEKALNRRGISAGLMYEVIRTWLWVLDDPLQDHNEYAQYGLPLFKAVALKFGFDNPIGDNAGNETKYAALE